MLVQQKVEVMSLFLMAMGVRYTIKIQARVGEYLKTLEARNTRITMLIYCYLVRYLPTQRLSIGRLGARAGDTVNFRLH